MIRIITTEEERASLCPARKFEQISGELGKEEVSLHVLKEEEIEDVLKSFGKEDTILAETKNYRILTAVRESGIRSTAENIQAVKFDEDKILLKRVLAPRMVLTPREVNLATENTLHVSYFVKPLMLEDSIGIDERSLCRNVEEAKRKVEAIRRDYGLPSIVEEYIDGEDVTCAVVKNRDGLFMLPVVIQPNAASPYLSYDAKNGNRETYSPVNDTILRMRICQAAAETFDAIGAEHYARIDMRIRDGRPYVLEVNLYPGLGNTGYMYQALRLKGYGYRDFLEEILSTATPQIPQR
jgi:D-alanine-D-alanine ligase